MPSLYYIMTYLSLVAAKYPLFKNVQESLLQARTRFLNRDAGAQLSLQRNQPIHLDQDPDQEVVTTTKSEVSRLHSLPPQRQTQSVRECVASTEQQKSACFLFLKLFSITISHVTLLLRTFNLELTCESQSRIVK